MMFCFFGPMTHASSNLRRMTSIVRIVWWRTIVVSLVVAFPSLSGVHAAPDGRTVTDHSFASRWLLVYFGYTACPDSCPTALADMAQTLKKLGADAPAVQALFITLDPSRDTREVINDYVRSFDPRIIGLTGTQDQIDTVKHAYGAYALPHDPEATGSSDLLDHSVYIYLMDPEGTFVRAFDPTWSSDQMADAIRHAFVLGRTMERRSVSDQER